MSQSFKLSLFLIFSAICFVLGWWHGVWHDDTVVNWIRYGGYWMILLSTLAWCFALIKAYPGILKPTNYRGLLQRKNWLPIGMILLAWAMIQFGEEKNFKILLDEPVLVNTSRMMHYDREVLVISNAERVDGILAAKGYVDKRPNFFPFLVCMIHDLTGYRVENAYYLNAFLTLALFALTYVVATQIAGRAAGTLALWLLASIPLIWHQSSGAGFEILNLVMILLTLKVALDFFQHPSNNEKLSALCLTVAMLAQVRYESVLFVIPIGILILMGWSLNKKISLPWGAWATPVLLIPVLWQQRVFNLDASFWELFTVGTDKPFSFDYYSNNLGQAVYFFFEWIRQIPNAPLVGYIGWLAVAVFLICITLRLVRKERREEIVSEHRPTFVLWVFFVGFGLYFTLLMCYAFDLGRYMVERLALPLYLAIILAASVVWCGWIRGRWWYRAIAIVVAVGFVGWTLPSASAREYAAIYFPMVEGKYVEQFIKQHKDERYLIVADMSMLWTVYNVEAIPNRALNNQMREVKYYLEHPNNPPVYVVQSMEFDPATNRYHDIASDPLTDRAILRPMNEYHVGSFRILRISRLVELDGVEAVDDSDLYKGSESQNLQDWVSQLP